MAYTLYTPYCVWKEREQTNPSRIVTRINREQTITKLVFKSVRCVLCSLSAAVASCSSVWIDALVIVVYFCDCAKMGFASGVVKYLVFLANLVFAVSKTILLNLVLVLDFLTHFLIFYFCCLVIIMVRDFHDDLIIKVHLESGVQVNHVEWLCIALMVCRKIGARFFGALWQKLSYSKKTCLLLLQWKKLLSFIKETVNNLSLHRSWFMILGCTTLFFDIDFTM